MFEIVHTVSVRYYQKIQVGWLFSRHVSLMLHRKREGEHGTEFEMCGMLVGFEKFHSVPNLLKLFKSGNGPTKGPASYFRV